MLIPDDIVIDGLDKLPISRGHLYHCIDSSKRTICTTYEYFGKNVFRGHMLINTNYGIVWLEFDEFKNIARKIKIHAFIPVNPIS